MEQSIHDFQNLLEKKNIDMMNKYLKEILDNFDFIFYPDIIQTEKRAKQYENNSKIIIIDEYIQNNVKYYVICFDYKLIILPNEDQKGISILGDIIINFDDCDRYFLQNCDIKSETDSADKNDPKIFLYEIQSFSREFSIRSIKGNLSIESKIKIQNFWNIIVNCLSGFLIKKGYQNSRNRHDKYIKDEFVEYKEENANYTNKSYIELRNLGSGSGGTVSLIYYISKEEVFALKLPYTRSRLNERERRNYLDIRYPFIVPYIGYIKYANDPEYLLLEYVEGKTLDKNVLENLNDQEKYNIILELLLTIRYLHSQEYIYRDFGFSNIMINQNKDAILIDFDHLRKVTDEIEDEEQTKNFFGEAVAPEDIKTYKSDVYSLRYIFHFILYGKSPKINGKMEINQDFILESCLEEDPDKRPNLSEVIDIFYVNFFY